MANSSLPRSPENKPRSLRTRTRFLRLARRHAPSPWKAVGEDTYACGPSCTRPN